MSYQDFTFEDLIRQFRVSLDSAALFRDVPKLEPTPWLIESLQRGEGMALTSEKARSEAIVAPILLECRNVMGSDYSLYSGVQLDAGDESGLNGECDFIISHAPKAHYLRAPLLVVVEAKRGYIEGGVTQCVAQMLAARRFNEQREQPIEKIHGCVTSGDDWQFLRLAGDRITNDSDRYYLRDLSKLLGIFVSIMKGP